MEKKTTEEASFHTLEGEKKEKGVERTKGKNL